MQLTKKELTQLHGSASRNVANIHGEGRVFYTALGHREEVWSAPRFEKHLVNVIRWALRDLE